MIAIYVLMGNQSTRNLYYSLVTKDFTRVDVDTSLFAVLYEATRITLTVVQALSRGTKVLFQEKRY